ncbi:tctex1 domain-containing protein 2 [Drosophila novamexicana]|uniref:tctex1 domain-containing protein 2 n=1 Tax=Drosophila novamexicana TaxID=47314 RepID=UPI0011E588DE|nr:tctex1 domain-containing protein 2 [Drosophila novamexicana]
MPLFDTKTRKRTLVQPKKVRKSRNSNRVTITQDKTKGNEIVSADKLSTPTNPSGSFVESDSESDEPHPEASPATDVTIYNEYDMGPAFGCKFPLPFIRFMVERVLMEKLKGKTYVAGDAVKWVRDVADTINSKMKGYCLQQRYKHVINVSIYQQNGAGFFHGFRAVWDTLSDDYLRNTFDAGTFVCIVVIFGCYTY